MLVRVAKVAATALNSGSGAIGGVFTPSLFVGATAGSVLAQLGALWLPPDWIGDPRGRFTAPDRGAALNARLRAAARRPG